MATTPKKLALVIPGGGMLGALTAAILVVFENFLFDHGIAYRIRDIFHAMGGTSTGGLITAALAMGIPAAEIRELYRRLGPEIFRFDLPLFLGSRFSHRYSSTRLYELIHNLAGDKVINDLPVHFLTTAVHVRTKKTWYFVKDHRGNLGTTGRLPLAHCLTATAAAAPAFFAPHYIPGLGVFVDGGIGGEVLPTRSMAEELFHFTDGEWPDDQTIILTVGTGYFDELNLPTNIFRWLRWVVPTVLKAPLVAQIRSVRLDHPETVLYHVDTELPEPWSLDQFDIVDRLIDIGTEVGRTVDWLSIIEGRDNKWKVP